jgi:hypothetical protein
MKEREREGYKGQEVKEPKTDNPSKNRKWQ